MTTVNYINLSLEIWGCVISLFVVACILLGKSQRDKTTYLYFSMLFLNMSALFFDVLALYFRGKLTTVAWWGVRISNFVAFSSNALLLGAFALYLYEVLSNRTTVNRRPIQIAVWCSIVVFLLTIATQFYPITYSIDAQNMYHRESTFWLSHAVGVVGLLFCASVIFKYRKFIYPEEKIGFWCYIILPIIALTIQSFIYGVVFLGLANTSTLVIIFLFLQAKQGQKLAEQEIIIVRKEKEMTEQRMSIMLSQMQPHFLYNALSTIRFLCRKNPEKAEQAMTDFTEFLRGNMDSLTADKPISFEQELSHTKNYLALEKMRFGKKLNIEYDIETTLFRLPTLTLQPIVENAVRYGITKRVEGGTLKIATKETEKSFIVTITDDGVGYDIHTVKDDGRSHIGITNVKNRLDLMSNGTLEIESNLNVGTNAIITIPKEKIKC